jgi:lipid II:glycine glycyltransferase (peptidoglycan interpeptide bridge formation enzyme)
MQCRFWGDFKSRFGWTSYRFRLEDEPGQPSVLVLLRSMRFGLSFAYVPHGPDCERGESERGRFLAELSENLKVVLPKTCMFIRYDPPWYVVEQAREETDVRDSDSVRPLIGSPLLRAASDIQVPDTVLIDLTPSEEDILAAMKPKWRYNIRLAAKKAVEVSCHGADAVSEFYRLYRETAARDRIALHPEAYYRRLFEVVDEYRARGDEDALDLRLWIARKDGVALAAIITLFRADEAVYLYGASSNEGRECMPAYALQWEAMRAAKSFGCARYDLFGIPPSADPAHPMAGLYRFKTGFGGRIIHRAGSWDYPLKQLPYFAFRKAEGLRTWWFKVVRKRLRKTRTR